MATYNGAGILNFNDKTTIPSNNNLIFNSIFYLTNEIDSADNVYVRINNGLIGLLNIDG